MTPLRQRLIEELRLRGCSDKTRDAYVHAVACVAKYYRRSPDLLSDEELRAYLLYLHTETGKAASTLNVAVSGLRFFYQRVLHRPFFHLERNLPRPRQAKRRPKAYTVAEVKRLLEVGCPNRKHRAFLMTVYGAGLRLHEACCLRIRRTMPMAHGTNRCRWIRRSSCAVCACISCRRGSSKSGISDCSPIGVGRTG